MSAARCEPATGPTSTADEEHGKAAAEDKIAEPGERDLNPRRVLDGNVRCAGWYGHAEECAGDRVHWQRPRRSRRLPFGSVQRGNEQQALLIGWRNMRDVY